MTNHLRLLDLSGSPYAIGYAHGTRFADDIRAAVADRVALACSPAWGGRALARNEVLALADACVAEHQQYAPGLMQELQGMADASGTSPAELMIVNGFTDFVDTLHAHMRRPLLLADPQPNDNCTAFIVPDGQSVDGHGYFGQTWDMHATAMEFVALLRVRPDDAPAALLFTLTGCVGMIGMNEAGIAVGINNLLGGDGQVGVTWPFVVRKMLQQTTLDAALACLTEARLAGAHNYLLYDKHNQGYNVEAFSTHLHMTRLDGKAIAHTNHCLVPETIARSRPRLAQSQQHSEQRLTTADGLLQGPVGLDDLFALTRHPNIETRPTPPLDVATCGAAIMQPASGGFWAVWGYPSENEFEQFGV